MPIDWMILTYLDEYSFCLVPGRFKFPGSESILNLSKEAYVGQENPGKEQQLFMYLVGIFQSSAWIA